MTSWNEAKREASVVERNLESALGKYTRIQVDQNDPEFVSDVERNLELEVEQLLNKLSNCVDKLVACNDSDKPATSRAQISRLREILSEQRTKYRAAQNRLKQVRESEAFRKLIKRDARMDGNGDDLGQEMLMRERNSIMNSNRMAEERIDQANEIYDELRRQRTTFTGTTGRLIDMGKSVPGLNTLIKRIQDKRTRDNTIIALVIAFCICFLLWYWLSSWGL